MIERCFVSTTPGLEPALDLELRELGHRPKRLEGGAEVEGAPGLHRALNLELRSASRVLLRVGEFAAPSSAALEEGLSRVETSAYVRAGAAVRLKVQLHRSSLPEPRKVEAIALRTLGLTPNQAEDAPELSLRVDEGVATLSIDTSGELLFRRGYRQEVSRAPLRETLAAGMLLLAGYRGDEALWDPMCGSGTIPIEAAWIALRRAPGLSRSFAFETFPSFDAEAYDAQKATRRAALRTTPPEPLYASDVNAGSLGTARRNAKRAEVEPLISQWRQDVRKAERVPKERHGLLIANAPYGIRVGEREELVTLYSALGALLRDRLPGWRAAVLGMPEVKLEDALGLEVEDAFDLDNGGIRCRLLVGRSAR